MKKIIVFLLPMIICLLLPVVKCYSRRISVGITDEVTKVIYVDDDAAGASDGSNWTNAYNYLQDALTDANSADKPVEIRVAKGFYKPDQGIGITSGDREASFQLINGVTITGGYAGVDYKDPNARDIRIYETVFSGDLAGNDTTWKWNERQYVLLPEDTRKPIGIWLPGTNREDNTYHVVVGSNTDETAILDGVTVSNGNAVLPPYSSKHDRGGGMYCEAGSPIVINCTFKRNASSLYGGGIYMDDSSDIYIISCVVKENKSHGEGGGICCGGFRLRDGGVIQDCIITNNMAASGGGILCSGNHPLISNCLISGNLADAEPVGIKERRKGGGGITCFQSNPRIINCTIVGNKANAAGGGINCPSGWGKVILENCIIWGNSAEFGNQLARMCCGCVVGCQKIELSYCCIQMGENPVFAEWGDVLETGNKWIIDLQASHSIDSDPCFAALGYWADAIDSKIATDPNEPNAVWVDGDYHLKSQAGRWDADEGRWTKDDVTSPCIDAGDPNSPIDHEPFPNGGRINMGTYGGSSQASNSYFGKPVCQTIIASDINGDCKVDFQDFAIMASHWLEQR